LAQKRDSRTCFWPFAGRRAGTAASIVCAAGSNATSGQFKANRAIATRYDKIADEFLGMLYLAVIKLWNKFVRRA
jgi:hypothetical protein